MERIAKSYALEESKALLPGPKSSLEAFPPAVPRKDTRDKWQGKHQVVLEKQVSLPDPIAK